MKIKEIKNKDGKIVEFSTYQDGSFGRNYALRDFENGLKYDGIEEFTKDAARDAYQRYINSYSTIKNEDGDMVCTLEELCWAVNTNLNKDEFDITDLPTFGGNEPYNTVGIFSWDAENILVPGNNCGEDFYITERVAAEEEDRERETQQNIWKARS